MFPSANHSKKKIGLVVLAVAIVAVLGGEKIGALFAKASPEVQAKIEEKKMDRSATAPLEHLPHEGDFVMGNKKAKVAIVEYASLTCPHCAHFHRDVVEKIKEKYLDSGKAFYILRQFPLNEAAMKGAQLVTCIGDKEGAERYYTFTRALFNGQDKWAFQNDFVSAMKLIAQVGGVDNQAVDACLADKALETRILESIKADGDALKISATPTVYINGKQPEKPSLEAVEAMIEEALK
jgi:protein-disulfide isomerase